MNKGQVFTTDFIASITIFSFFLLFFGIAWNSSIDMFLERADSQETRMDDVYSLMKTEGAPSNWAEDNVSVIGFYEEGFLSAEKVSKFIDLPSSEKRRLLKTQEFLLEARYLNGSLVNYQGHDLKTNTSQIPEDRSVYVRNSITVLEENRKRVKLNYYSWEN